MCTKRVAFRARKPSVLRSAFLLLAASLPLLAGAASPRSLATMELEVVVVDEEGRPWDGAAVVAGGVMQRRLRWGGCAGDSTQRNALTDAGGRAGFELRLEDAEWVRVAAYVWAESGHDLDTGPGPQQWIKAGPGPRTVRLVMRRDTPLRSALVSEPALTSQLRAGQSRDRLRVVRADGSSERRPISGGGAGFRTRDDAAARASAKLQKGEVILRLPLEVLSSGPGWMRTSPAPLFGRMGSVTWDKRLEALEPELRHETTQAGLVEVEVKGENSWVARGRYTAVPGETVVVELAAVAPRRISGRAVAGGRPLDQTQVRIRETTVPIGADGRFVFEGVADTTVEVCFDVVGRYECRVVPSGGDMEVEIDLTPVRISGTLIGENWSDIWDLEMVGSPMTSHTIKPGILLGPDGKFETPELPAGCYELWGLLPAGGIAVAAVVRLEPGERAELVLDADSPSLSTWLGGPAGARPACQPIASRVLR